MAAEGVQPRPRRAAHVSENLPNVPDDVFEPLELSLLVTRPR
jgi:hypothetical protein